MGATERERRAATEQAETADRWEPYWSHVEYDGDKANPLAVEELQEVVKRLSERVSELEEKVESLLTQDHAVSRWGRRVEARLEALEDADED